MELKKNPKIDLEGKKTLFLEIGLCLSLTLMIITFGSNQKEIVIETPDDVKVPVELEPIDLTFNEESPLPPQPKQVIVMYPDWMNVVKDDTKIIVDPTFADLKEDEAPVGFITTGGMGDKYQEPELDPNVPVLKLQNMPKFLGQERDHFKTWVERRMQYPAEALANRVHGTVYVKFVIDKNGELTTIQLVKSPDQSLTDEVIRVLRQSPKWTPGIQRGITQAVWVDMSFTFVGN